MSLSKKEILITKHLSGNTTSEEDRDLMNWLNENPANQEEFDRAEKVWRAAAHLKRDTSADVDKAWADFKTITESGAPKAIKQKTTYTWLRVAAAVTLFAVIGVVAKVYFTQPSTTTSKELSVVSNPEQNQAQTVSTPDLSPEPVLQEPGKQVVKPKVKKTQEAPQPHTNSTAMVTVMAGDSGKVFMLPDNSIVYLNANGKIEYPENFNKTNRRLSLVGEAYFDIKKDSGLFVVACENTITRGKGTSFNIKGRSEDKEVEVIVASGKVEFSGIGSKDYKKLVIGAGETGRYIKEKNTLMKSSFQRKNYKWWQLNGFKERIKRFFDKIFGKSSTSKNAGSSK